jgi:hypothetical protein
MWFSWIPVGKIKGFGGRCPFPLAICKLVSSVKPETTYKVLTEPFDFTNWNPAEPHGGTTDGR